MRHFGADVKRMLAPAYRLLEQADVYAAFQRLGKPTTDRFDALMRRHLALPPEARLLDIGCGVAGYRANFACDYFGVDFNASYVRKGTSALAGTFLVMDCTRLGFQDRSFDHVLSVATTHHLSDAQLMLMVQEGVRVCRPGGQFHIIDAILPVSPNFAFKKLWFHLDRGAHPRSLDNLTELIAGCGTVRCREVVTGPLHDVVYIAVAAAA